MNPKFERVYAFNAYKRRLIDNQWKVASTLTPVPPSRFARSLWTKRKTAEKLGYDESAQ